MEEDASQGPEINMVACIVEHPLKGFAFIPRSVMRRAYRKKKSFDPRFNETKH